MDEGRQPGDAHGQSAAEVMRRVRALLLRDDLRIDPDDRMILDDVLARLEERECRAPGARPEDIEAAEDARQRLRIYRRLTDDAPNAIVMVNRESRFTYANATYLRLHEVPEDAVVGQDLKTVIGEEHYQVARAQLDQVFRGETVEFSTWYHYPSGNRYMHVYYYPVHVDETVQAVGVILTDITAQAKIEEALRDSEERFYAFSEASTEGIIIHERGIILEVNTAIAEHLGYTPEEMLGKSVLELTALESREEMVRRMLARDPGPYTAVSLHKDGSHTIGEIRARDFTYKGRAVRLVAIRDITELRHAQERLEALLANAEAWAAEMDAVITSIADGVIIYNMDGLITRMNPAITSILGLSTESTVVPRQDIFAQQRIETAEGAPIPFEELPHRRALLGASAVGEVMVLYLEARQPCWVACSAAPIHSLRGELLGAVLTIANITQMHALQEERELYVHTISHDLRTPLAIIRGHAQLIRDHMVQEEQHDEAQFGIEAILRSTQRMNTLIQDMVDVARFEGGKVQLQLRPVNLPVFLGDLLKRSEAVIETERIIVEQAGVIPFVMADYDRLERIIINLLSNAMKYSPKNSSVIVRMERAGNLVAVSVQDFGRGIPEEAIPHLFERYYRVAGTEKVEGIGLGLYITRLLVNAHHGDIWVESRVGEGSTFTFTLPIARDET
ncbi:MAG: Sensor histidine kinase YycG [bacterium ADurb.Bin429]|nr:MAG: Sensor histidine kinase YycG [bacterium ADurb.Bin429]